MFQRQAIPTPAAGDPLDGAAIAAIWPCAGLLFPLFIPEIGAPMLPPAAEERPPARRD